MPVDPRNQTQKTTFASTIVANQSNSVALENVTGNILKCCNNSTASAPTQTSTSDRANQRGFQTTSFRRENGNIETYILELEND